MRGLLRFLADLSIILIGRATIVAGIGLILFGSFADSNRYVYYIGAALLIFIGAFIASRRE